jgi:Ca2+-transporting ATPase
VSMILLIPPLRNFFSFAVPPIEGLVVAFLTGFISVIWFEVFKAVKRS